MSFLRRIPIRSLSNRVRSYSYCNCKYDSDKHTLSPFFASLLVGGLFNLMIFNRMNMDIQYQYNEFEKVKADLKEIKSILNKK